MSISTLGLQMPHISVIKHRCGPQSTASSPICTTQQRLEPQGKGVEEHWTMRMSCQRSPEALTERLIGMRCSQRTITDRAATFANYPGRIRALLVVYQSLTVLKVLEAFILDFELKWVDEQGRIVQYVYGRDVDGRHAALSGPGSLEVFDGTGSVRARCALSCLLFRSLIQNYSLCFQSTQRLPSEAKLTSWRPLHFMKLDAAEQGELPSSWLDCPCVGTAARKRCRSYASNFLCLARLFLDAVM